MITKTIITKDPVMESEGSLFPCVRLTYDEAVERAARLGGRLPTSGEYDRLFKARPWPHLIYEWTATQYKKGYQLVRGGSWAYDPRNARASYRDWFARSNRNDNIGFRCAKDIPTDAPVPEGWIEI